MDPDEHRAVAVADTGADVDWRVASDIGARVREHRRDVGDASGGSVAGYKSEQFEDVGRAPSYPSDQSTPFDQSTARSADAARPLLANRYSLNQVIGEGAYGVVASADDRATGNSVAIKRMRRVLDSQGLGTRVLRELKFLRLLSGHENVVEVKDILLPADRDRFDDMFVVFELMPCDLFRVINSTAPLDADNVRFLMFQLLRAVHYMHASGVLHRDLKPSNVLVDGQCRLKVCDLGRARAVLRTTEASDADLVLWTEYVAYCAPELLLPRSRNSSTAIDLWSCGCIFAEMLLRKPLFPGKDANQQLALITEFTGKPDLSVIQRLFSSRGQEVLSGMPKRALKEMADVFPPVTDPAVLRLIRGMLEFDPERRMTARESLMDDYFTAWREPLGFGPPPRQLEPAEFDFEKQIGKSAGDGLASIRRELLVEICSYHPEKRDELLNYVQGSSKEMSSRTPFVQTMENLAVGGGAGVLGEDRYASSSEGYRKQVAEGGTQSQLNRVNPSVPAEIPGPPTTDRFGSLLVSGDLDPPSLPPSRPRPRGSISGLSVSDSSPNQPSILPAPPSFFSAAGKAARSRAAAPTPRRPEPSETDAGKDEKVQPQTREVLGGDSDATGSRAMSSFDPSCLESVASNESSELDYSACPEEALPGVSVAGALKRLDLAVRQTLGLCIGHRQMAVPLERAGLLLREDVSTRLASEGAAACAEESDGAVGDWRGACDVGARVREWVSDVMNSEDVGDFSGETEDIGGSRERCVEPGLTPSCMDSVVSDESSDLDYSACPEEARHDGSIENALERLDLQVRQALGLCLNSGQDRVQLESIGAILRRDIAHLLACVGAASSDDWRSVSDVGTRVRVWVCDVVKGEDEDNDSEK